MKNFQCLLAAWIAVWVVFFFYQISLSRRFSQLLDEVKRLKERLQ
jgi:CcmD family protein